MKLETAIDHLKKGKPVGKMLILAWLKELKDYREHEKSERDKELEKAGY